MLNKAHLIAVAFVAAVAFAAPAQARESTQSVRISYAGLNLQTEAGADVFVSRIQSAARRLCRRSEFGGPIELQRRGDAVACREAVMTQAASQIDAPLVATRIASLMTPRVYASN